MGNCMMRTSRSRQVVEDEEIEEIHEAATEFDEVEKGSSIKVKIVLTKEELALFLLKLKNNNSNGGNKCLEDLLAEMEKARSGKLDHSWRPSLESIIEEVGPEIDRS